VYDQFRESKEILKPVTNPVGLSPHHEIFLTVFPGAIVSPGIENTERYVFGGALFLSPVIGSLHDEKKTNPRIKKNKAVKYLIICYMMKFLLKSIIKNKYYNKLLNTVKFRTFTMKIADTFQFSNLQEKVAIKMAKIAIMLAKVAIKMVKIAIKMVKIAIKMVKIAIKMAKIAIKTANIDIKMAKIAIMLAKIAIRMKSFARRQTLLIENNILTIRTYVRTLLLRDKSPEQDILL